MNTRMIPSFGPQLVPIASSKRSPNFLGGGAGFAGGAATGFANGGVIGSGEATGDLTSACAIAGAGTTVRGGCAGAAAGVLVGTTGVAGAGRAGDGTGGTTVDGDADGAGTAQGSSTRSGGATGLAAGGGTGGGGLTGFSIFSPGTESLCSNSRTFFSRSKTRRVSREFCSLSSSVVRRRRRSTR